MEEECRVPLGGKKREQKLRIQWSGNNRRENERLHNGQQSILDCWKKPTTSIDDVLKERSIILKAIAKDETVRFMDKDPSTTIIAPKSGMFKDPVFYVNGSTYPHIGNCYVKSLISQHGGLTTLVLERRRVTHVILTPKISISASSCQSIPQSSGADLLNSSPFFRSVGCGLAAGKLQKQMTVTRGASLNIHFISPAWVTGSVKAGHRLPEVWFSDWRMTNEKQGSVLDKFYWQAKAVNELNPNKN
jgi:hypothetical protein